MRRWTIILIAIIILLFILILIFNYYGTSSQVNEYAQMEIEMRKLWY
ncbi:hypothetical protein [Methanobrevibacter sp.]